MLLLINSAYPRWPPINRGGQEKFIKGCNPSIMIVRSHKEAAPLLEHRM